MAKSAQKFILRILVVLSLIAGLRLSAAQPAQAALAVLTLSVNTTSDTHDVLPGNGVCLDSHLQCSLRAAIEEANAYQLQSAFTITVPADTYTLSQGELSVAPQGFRTITITGAGAATTIISQGDLTHRVFNIDSGSAGGANAILSGLTISGGHDASDSLGGAGILAGSLSSTPPDILSLQNCVVSGNHVSSPAATTNPGGGIQMDGGNLAVSNCTFSNNTSGASWGGAIAFITPTVAGTLSITGSTFTTNAMDNTSSSGSTGGGALYINGTSESVHTISGSTFSSNTATGSSTGTTYGGAILLNTGTLNIDHSTFTGNAAIGQGGQGGAIYVDSGALNITTSRLSGNNATHGASAIYSLGSNGASTSALNDWWGCSGGPGAAGCDTVAKDAGTLAFSPYIVLTHTPNLAAILIVQSTTLTASFLENSSGTPLAAGDVAVLIGLPVTWTDAVLGTLSNQQAAIQSNGKATATFTAGITSGTGHATARVDNDAVTADIPINPGHHDYLPVIMK